MKINKEKDLFEAQMTLLNAIWACLLLWVMVGGSSGDWVMNWQEWDVVVVDSGGWWWWVMVMVTAKDVWEWSLQLFSKRLAVPNLGNFENKQNKTNPIIGFSLSQPSCSHSAAIHHLLQHNAILEDIQRHQNSCYVSLWRWYSFKAGNSGLS